MVYLVVFYENESSVFGVRYRFQTTPVPVTQGMRLKPIPQGNPVGFGWYKGDGTLVKECGDTSTEFLP